MDPIPPTGTRATSADAGKATSPTSLGKGLELLALLAEGEGPMRLGELAQRAGRPRSTVHRLLATMQEWRVVEQAEDGRYSIGLRLFEMGSRAVVRVSLRDVAAPELRRLSSELGETSHLGVLDAGEVVYIEKVESSASIRMSSQVGHRKPLHCTGIGKALLAHATEEVIDAVCSGELMARTQRTITSDRALREELESIRARGFSVDDEEWDAGLRCVAAPVLGPDRRALAAVSVAGPAMRMDMERCHEMGPVLAAAAERIARRHEH